MDFFLAINWSIIKCVWKKSSPECLNCFILIPALVPCLDSRLFCKCCVENLHMPFTFSSVGKTCFYFKSVFLLIFHFQGNKNWSVHSGCWFLYSWPISASYINSSVSQKMITGGKIDFYCLTVRRCNPRWAAFCNKRPNAFCNNFWQLCRKLHFITKCTCNFIL